MGAVSVNVVTIVLFVAGGVLVYAGIKDKDPRTVITDALTGSAQPKRSSAPRKPPEPPVEPAYDRSGV